MTSETGCLSLQFGTRKGQNLEPGTSLELCRHEVIKLGTRNQPGETSYHTDFNRPGYLDGQDDNSFHMIMLFHIDREGHGKVQIRLLAFGS